MLEIGSPEGLFVPEYYRYHKNLATKCWAHSTWEFLQRYKIHIETDTPTLAKQCHTDKFLMVEFAKYCEIKQLPFLNYCHLHLQVNTLAEIVTADGRYITRAAWDGRRDPTRSNRYHWPEQKRPADSHWDTFQTALCKTFKCSKLRFLDEPLQWDVNPENSNPWKFYFCSTTDRLFQRQTDGWTVHIRTGKGKRLRQVRYRKEPHSYVPELPTTARKATVDDAPTSFFHTGTHDNADPLPTPPATNSTDVISYLKSLPLARSWAWTYLELTGSIDDLIESLLHGDNRSISNGSFGDFFTSSGFSVVCDTTNVYLKGANIPPGFQKGQSPYRGELAGLYALIFVITSILEWKYGSEARNFNGMVNVGCDGLSALQQCFDEDHYFTSGKPDFDLIIAARRRIAEFPGLHWCSNHVEGHQDDDKEAVLDEWAQQNVEMDTLAKAYRVEMYTKLKGMPPQHRVDYSPWMAFIEGQMITTWVGKTLRDHSGKSMILDYWSQKNRMRESTPYEVDWPALEKALLDRGSNKRREMIKHSTGFFGHGQNQLLWNKWKDSKCPRCGAPVEDADHIIKCQTTDSNDIWEGGITGLRIKLQDLHTQTHIEEVIRE
jgi:hypothetical protein